MDGETILILLLSVGFVVLTILAIIFMVILIKIASSARRIANRAEDASEDLAAAAKLVGRKVAPVALSGLAAAIVKRWRKR